MGAQSAGLVDQVALVTGATSGIGRATALRLAEQGARVVATGRDGPRGHAIVEAIRARGGDGDFLAADLSDATDCRTLAAAAGAVDILVNNAAVAPLGPTPSIREKEFDWCYAINVKAPFILVSELAPAMAQRGRGTIINVSTMVATFGSAGSAAYGSSKAALNALTRSWAAEFGPRGVRVNAVAPGPTLTEGTDAAFGAAGLERLATAAPARRVADPDEIAQVICFLAAGSADFIHGAIIPVDGGRTAV